MREINLVTSQEARLIVNSQKSIYFETKIDKDEQQKNSKNVKK